MLGRGGVACTYPTPCDDLMEPLRSASAMHVERKVTPEDISRQNPALDGQARNWRMRVSAYCDAILLLHPPRARRILCPHLTRHQTGPPRTSSEARRRRPPHPCPAGCRVQLLHDAIGNSTEEPFCGCGPESGESRREERVDRVAERVASS